MTQSKRLFLVPTPTNPKLAALIASQEAATKTFGKLPRALKPLGYVSGQSCVNCGHLDRQFNLGRSTAECAHCGDVVSL